ncbi:esterase-like activity of phytase family protein [Chelatococcus reniformis]|uniref:Phytase-like domain-containing protein n=1 Tax=Chelatococcus reniformis TaxID=1494448 RepID=A0A916XJQ4_9HYPH|nr:esterase-like activity of phytase family protein [Chelatococcus reniformis]GGC78761.1 hypothetical protein GCM10010994_41140 [Chelatococcus reniformis]
MSPYAAGARLAATLLLLAPLGGAPRAEAGGRAADVAVQPARGFDRAAPEATRFGALDFRGGLVLSARDSDFGGWSGLWRSADGRRLVAISDKGTWMTATPRYDGGRLAGLDEVKLAPALSGTGEPLGETTAYDTEGLAIVDGTAYVSIERTHEVLRFAFGRDGTAARGETVSVPPAAKRLRSNSSLEAIGVAPPASPIAGAVVTIAEQSDGDGPTRGWILTGPAAGEFRVARHDGFDITDLAFLPGGDMLLLERFYTRATGVKLRLRRVAAADVKAGALLDGPVLATADKGFEIDNMEGLALHRTPSGETILTIISDDNFSSEQRTILLEFALSDGAAR